MSLTMKKTVTLKVEAKEWRELKSISKRTGRTMCSYVREGLRTQLDVGRAEVAELTRLQKAVMSRELAEVDAQRAA